MPITGELNALARFHEAKPEAVLEAEDQELRSAAVAKTDGGILEIVRPGEGRVGLIDVEEQQVLRAGLDRINDDGEATAVGIDRDVVIAGRRSAGRLLQLNRLRVGSVRSETDPDESVVRVGRGCSGRSGRECGSLSFRR